MVRLDIEIRSRILFALLAGAFGFFANLVSLKIFHEAGLMPGGIFGFAVALEGPVRSMAL